MDISPWINEYIPPDTPQCNRLKELVMADYKKTAKIGRYNARKGLIIKYLYPFTIKDFLGQEERGREIILNTYQ